MIKLVAQLNSNADFSAYSIIWQSVCDYGDGGDPIVCCPSDSNSQGSGYWFLFAPMNTETPATNVDTVTGGWNWGDSNGINFDTTESTTQTSPVTIPTYDAASDNRCGITNASHTRVVGGREASRGAYPWIAALLYQTQGNAGLKQLCGGSLITKRHVLTAAHCGKPTLRSVALGIHDINKLYEGVVIQVEKTRVHEEYDSKKIVNDICMLKLIQDAPINDFIRPICLPTQEPQRSMDLTGYQPFVAGWGTTSTQGPAANVLQEVQVPVVSTQSCGNSYKTFFPNQVYDNRIICAGATGRDSCQGDSGGPLMFPVLSANGNYYYYVLIGVVSYGYECGTPGFPGVYTRVTTFLPWIQRNLN
ncbi:venom serine protease Bi-VSP [Culicoides brevitarsis]|uniref:venom serine protease Bi-VSP n=1 Tax=Culicoides brevitarsis TaxID=469753 RepID=UPI00307C6F0E